MKQAYYNKLREDITADILRYLERKEAEKNDPISATEAAYIIGKHPNTIHRYREAGMLKANFVNGAFQFSRADVLRFKNGGNND